MRKNLLILATIAAAVTAGQASAHARLIHATPKVGSTVVQSPRELRLSFSETIVTKDSGVTVTGPGGAKVALGRITADAKDPRAVVVPIAAALAPGRYHVEWRMKTADTHTMDGDYFFNVKR